MHFSNLLLGVAALAAATIQAATFDVEVGVGTSLIYSPNDITAAVGDLVVFHFNPKNHSVVQSSFGQPCVPLASGGFFSGFVPTPVPSTTTFTVTVADLKPIWFYCAQTVGSHCQKGMVGAINPPPVGNTLTAFEALAAATNMSIAPPGGPTGGALALGTTSAIATTNSTASNATVTTASVPSSTSPIEFTGAAKALAADMFVGLAGVAAVLALL